jgi:hypothetical protein
LGGGGGDNDCDYENTSKLNLVKMYLIIDLKNLLISFSVLSSHVCLGLENGLIHSVFMTKILYATVSMFCVFDAAHSHPPLF